MTKLMSSIAGISISCWLLAATILNPAQVALYAGWVAIISLALAIGSSMYDATK